MLPQNSALIIVDVQNGFVPVAIWQSMGRTRLFR